MNNNSAKGTAPTLAQLLADVVHGELDRRRAAGEMIIARVQRLEQALRAVANKELPDGSLCWCPMHGGTHSGYCGNARVVLNDGQEVK